MENSFQKNCKEAIKKIKSGKSISPMQAIRLKCLDCVCWQSNEVSKCEADDCILWYFRNGKPNAKKRVLSEKHLQALKQARHLRKRSP